MIIWLGIVFIEDAVRVSEDGAVLCCTWALSV